MTPPDTTPRTPNISIASERDAACDVAWLGVWSNNTGAQRFYRHWGFERVGEQDFMVGPERQTGWSMKLVIRSNSATLRARFTARL